MARIRTKKEQQKRPSNNRVTRHALKNLFRSDIVCAMKTKSHILTSAMALCAAAVFSFTTAPAAKAGSISGGSDSIVEPAPVDDRQPATFGIQPVPAPSETAPMGTFTGTVMAD
jgi:hypothetical protein